LLLLLTKQRGVETLPQNWQWRCRGDSRRQLVL